MSTNVDKSKAKKRQKVTEMADGIEQAAGMVQELQTAHANYKTQVEQITNNPRINEEARKADLTLAHTAFEQHVTPLKAQALASIEQQRAAAQEEEADLMDAVSVRPRDASQWQIAAAQDRFVAEDVTNLIEGGQASQIAVQFRRAMKRGDVAAAYLLARHGERQLRKAGNLNDPHATGNERERQALQALSAARAAYEKVDPAKLQSIKDRSKRLSELSGRAHFLTTPSELNALEQRFPRMARFQSGGAQ